MLVRSPFAFLLLAGVVAAQQPVWGQCGGIGWTGATTCASGSFCQYSNDWYSQCVPGSASTSAPAPPPTTTTRSTSQTSGPTPTGNPPVPTNPGTQCNLYSNLSPEWAAAYTKARAALAKLSLKEKVDLGTGVQWQKGHCVGNTPAISSISFPGLCLQDGPLGVRYADQISAFPALINVGSTFNRTLARQYGVQLGSEFRGKGVNVALGPMMNIVRAPAAGRNWEGFGADPYLSGEGAFQYITGMQSQGVQATAKHYINNEQEHFRDAGTSVVDDRYSNQHEIYLAPFLKSVQANVAAVMCSYISQFTPVNGTWACENDKTLNGLLKGELGFPGCESLWYWWATHSTTSVNKGLDMTMPGDKSYESGTSYFGQELITAVNAGQVPQSRIDDIALRVLAAWYLVGQDSGYPAVNFDSWNINDGFNKHVNVQSTHKDLIRQIGVASTVLLKNTNGVLPLKAPKSLAIIGSHAGPSSRGPNGYEDRGGNVGVLAMGWGSGTCQFPYLVAHSDAITTRARQDGTTVTASLSDTDLNAAATAASGKDVALVFVTSDSGEAYINVEGNDGDRNDLKAWHNGDALVARVASVNPRTVVVVNSVGPIVMEPWITHPNGKKVWGGLPGQEAGNALTDILYGAYNPSGRLPYTIGKSVDDYSAKVSTASSTVTYSDGIFVDYRHFDRNNIQPRFEFGFGLSYTTFSYSNLIVSGSTTGGTQPTGLGSSLSPWLHDKVVSVTFTLTNNGTVAGHEIPQLYLSPPTSAQSAPRNLKGFDSVYLAPGASKSVTLQLSRHDFSIWDTAAQRWTIPTGATGISVGASSRDIRLTGSITN
ncbi:glycoside hydrolase family 3 protein [Pluteus cervinus]|uniref:Glycoside hydrolase family 3 protein n=1 Tax=Pluteus cervinus TaxID=181527 RepID=A0ACD3BII9_9AGAR|nr:glycoside hydrolase family 3 protein [Pluteus cervinus]